MLDLKNHLYISFCSLQLHQFKLKVAQLLCQTIPDHCPFERDVKLWGWMSFHIPPLCKLNPFYEQFIRYRFWALCYLESEENDE